MHTQLDILRCKKIKAARCLPLGAAPPAPSGARKYLNLAADLLGHVLVHASRQYQGSSLRYIDFCIRLRGSVRFGLL